MYRLKRCSYEQSIPEISQWIFKEFPKCKILCFFCDYAKSYCLIQIYSSFCDNLCNW